MPSNQNSIKEYIGARYVPLFYDDGTGSAEWTNTVDYEPLTIVVHEGNSYTSRQYVPVGVNITDTRYWLETGNWNSQVESYRREVLQFDGRITTAQTTATNARTAATAAQTAANQAQESATSAGNAAATAKSIATGAVNVNNTQNTQISDLTSRVSALETRPVSADKLRNRNLVFVGDSYQQGTTQGGTTTSFLDRIINWGLLASGHYWRVEAGGAGFTRENNFLAMLQSVAAGLTADQKTAMTDIVVTGCYNDASSDFTAIVNAISSFCTYCNNNFPNAQVTLIPAGWRRFDGVAAQTFTGLYNAVHAWYNGATQNGCSFSPGAHSLFARMPIYISGDGIHPTTEGYTELARVVVNALTGGDDTFKIQNTVAIPNVAPAISGASILGDWYILPRGNEVVFTTANNMTCDFGNIAHADRPVINGRGGFIPMFAAGPWPFVFPGGHFVGESPVVLAGWVGDSQTQVFVTCNGVWSLDANGVLGLSITHGFAADGSFGTFTVRSVIGGIVSFEVYT